MRSIKGVPRGIRREANLLQPAAQFLQQHKVLIARLAMGKRLPCGRSNFIATLPRTIRVRSLTESFTTI